ncbi:MAG: peptide-methionine (S)-S-oxide reductase [Euryarchaeota archaeon]|jgi:peptide-methionine (S)-S-oxide reductase|nr:peptide-methionine (S)-S-oxide reductase [Euryarchaeota archaeon]MDP6489645.1 peptide-methionine (S)-S-oxide reductase MsrA [Candidatus Poseidoniia archaeon]MDP6658433.1 peptide-methionine (S)-S-oxide reductase MsrA [Candidatus Poseidoniia archaeon]MDP6834751.1 peptide-methionine (S)-S-oxide reductase MsrA [Candidatus Poseidoniia archaeon]MDP7007644.1 peptide-methionine (S)-S-oxide reductase MsrA [Candidatus Poseidoniia archaeon]|tara:strand:- start:3893 stop:4366 length:474 start_codon:yes stop_codon:yes gene_type:complete
MATETAIFAAGCFWGIEAHFGALAGVTATEVGYSGGETRQPTYRQVCTGATGHAEVVRVAFDPVAIGYGELLAAFWECHDPTQLNRQGPDSGTQYRSAIFCHGKQQLAAASASLAAAQPRFGGRIATQVEPAGEFWRAEEYHQRYFEKNPAAAACHT